MKKVYFLSSCSTCKTIIVNLGLADSFELQDIKTNKITKDQLEYMLKLAGSASRLFSKRSRKYKQLKKQVEEMGEEEILNLIMEEYTFLKRPVVIVDDEIFIGSSKNEISSLSRKLNPSS